MVAALKPKTSESINSFIYGISKIRPYLYISGYQAVPRNEKIKTLPITHAIDASNILNAKELPHIQYLYIKINDDEISDIKQYFIETSAFIQSAKKAGGKVLVYCAAGISRSATLCIMYLVIHENLSLLEAFNEIRQSRLINPNLSFWRQMIEYETEALGKSSVNLIKKDQLLIPDIYLNNENHKKQKKKFCLII